MIYVIESVDVFRLKQESSKLIKKISDQNSDIIKFDAVENDLNDIIFELSSPSLLAKKIIVITSPFFLESDLPKNQETELTNLFSEASDDIDVVILIDFKIAKKNKLYKFLDDTYKIKKISNLNENDLPKYISELLNEEEYKINELALDELIYRTQGNLLAISHELEKLKMYCDNKEITLQDVKDLVVVEIDKKLYELTNCYFEKNQKKLIEIYYDLVANSLNKSENKFDINILVLNAFINKVQELFYTKELLLKNKSNDEIAAFHQVKTTQAYYMVKTAKQTSNNELERIVKNLNKLDKDLKFSSVDKKQAVELFLLNKN